MEQKSLSVFDYSGKKVCDLYDSTVQTPGQAFDISVPLLYQLLMLVHITI